MQKPVIIGLGEVLWDMLPSGKQLGGAPANFVYHAACLGAEAYIVTGIGNDELGKEILDTFSQRNISVQYVETVTYPTGTVDVALDEAGVPKYSIVENVAWDHIPYSEKTELLVQKAHAVCFGSLAQRNDASKKTIHRFLQHTTKDCLKVFDINLRYPFYSKDVIASSLKDANILKVNDEELGLLAAMFSLPQNQTEIIERLFEQYSFELIAVTAGVNGSSLYTKENESFLPTPVINVADTIGAGDSFTAAMITGLLNKLSLTDLHQRAMQLAAYVCTNPGAMPLYEAEVLFSYGR
ncbi:MAG: carbohydrate kinase family protein [Ilyomonas sp.]